METKPYNMTLCIGCNVGNEPTYSQDEVIDAVADCLPYNFTAIKTIGRYNGITEQSVQITFCGLTEDLQNINKAVKRLCAELKQECIMQLIEDVKNYSEVMPA